MTSTKQRIVSGMKNRINQCILFIILLLMAVPLLAQSAATEPRVIPGSKVLLTFKNLPSGEAATVDGEYQVSRADGTVALPYLSARLKVVGKTARQVEDMVRAQYISQEIYTDPIVIARVGSRNETELDARFIQVAGHVAAKKNLPYREGITLFQAFFQKPQQLPIADKPPGSLVHETRRDFPYKAFDEEVRTETLKHIHKEIQIFIKAETLEILRSIGIFLFHPRPLDDL